MCQAAVSSPVLFAKNLSLSLSLSRYLSLSVCLSVCLSPGRVDDVYVLSPGPALSTHEFERIFFFCVLASYSNWRRQQLPVFNCVVWSPARELPSLRYRKSVLCLLSRNKQKQAMRSSCRDDSWILVHWSKLCRRLCSSRSSITVDAAFVPSVPESYFWKLVAAAAAAMEEASNFFLLWKIQGDDGHTSWRIHFLLSLLITHLQELYLFEQNLLQKVEYKLQQAQHNRLPSKVYNKSSCTRAAAMALVLINCIHHQDLLAAQMLQDGLILQAGFCVCVGLLCFSDGCELLTELCTGAWLWIVFKPWLQQQEVKDQLWQQAQVSLHVIWYPDPNFHFAISNGGYFLHHLGCDKNHEIIKVPDGQSLCLWTMICTMQSKTEKHCK